MCQALRSWFDEASGEALSTSSILRVHEVAERIRERAAAKLLHVPLSLSNPEASNAVYLLSSARTAAEVFAPSLKEKLSGSRPAAGEETNEKLSGGASRSAGGAAAEEEGLSSEDGTSLVEGRRGEAPEESEEESLGLNCHDARDPCCQLAGKKGSAGRGGGFSALKEKSQPQQRGISASRFDAYYPLGEAFVRRAIRAFGGCALCCSGKCGGGFAPLPQGRSAWRPRLRSGAPGNSSAGESRSSVAESSSPPCSVEDCPLQAEAASSSYPGSKARRQALTKVRRLVAATSLHDDWSIRRSAWQVLEECLFELCAEGEEQTRETASSPLLHNSQNTRQPNGAFPLRGLSPLEARMLVVVLQSRLGYVCDLRELPASVLKHYPHALSPLPQGEQLCSLEKPSRLPPLVPLSVPLPSGPQRLRAQSLALEAQLASERRVAVASFGVLSKTAAHKLVVDGWYWLPLFLALQVVPCILTEALVRQVRVEERPKDGQAPVCLRVDAASALSFGRSHGLPEMQRRKQGLRPSIDQKASEEGTSEQQSLTCVFVCTTQGGLAREGALRREASGLCVCVCLQSAS